MRRNLLRVSFWLCAVVLLAGPAAKAQKAPLRYALGFEQPNTHLVDVTIEASGLESPTASFAIPAWAPGHYVINNYAMNVQNFRAADPAGRPLAWQKTDKQTWEVKLGGSTGVTIQYQMFANTLENSWAQYNERHAFIDGPSLWMYLVGEKGLPIRLTIATPQGWRVATGMERTGPATFAAPDYDTFADCPLEISDFAEEDFTLEGTTYHVIVHDVEGKKDFAPFVHDLEKIVRTEVAVFAPVAGEPRSRSDSPSAGAGQESRAAPFGSYWFLFHIWPNTGGGLEHLNSTQIDFSTDWDNLQPTPHGGTAYQGKLWVAAHEFFHAWNVKRLRPRPLGPFDYSREAYTPSLWISEGLTSYYGSLSLVRAGLVSPQAYLNHIAGLITRFEQEPGRSERSIAQTSWDTWFEGSHRNETNLANTSYSYYDGGQILGHLLDFTIRHDTQNRHSLDDWMRLLYRRYALPKPGFEPEDVVRAASEVAGSDLSDFFRRYVAGKDALPYETCFAYAGIRVEKRYQPAQPWIGLAVTTDSQGRAVIGNVLPGFAAEKAELDRGDVILAVEGKAVDQKQFLEAVAARKPGQVMKLLVLRWGEMREFPVTVGSYPYATYSLEPVKQPTKLQEEIYRSWLGLQP
jgi:predicted metalloprotease with PDZ domain